MEPLSLLCPIVDQRNRPVAWP